MTITVEIKSVYGTELVYPVCEKALMFAKIAGTKTLARNTLAMIKHLGYNVNIKQIEL